jgi:molybdopterin/thiamine biosynthesis adenylyltransferase
MTFTPAEVLDETQPTDAARLAQLRGLDPAVFDTVAQQRRGLAELLPAAPTELLDEPTRWVYYPWRRSLVHILGPVGYRVLRTDRNRNKIPGDEQERLASRTIGVVGLSVGHTIAYTLVLEGICGQLRLADFDRIELSNLNRIPGSVFDLGVNKAVVAAQRIAELDPYLPVTVLEDGLTDDTMQEFVDGLDVVIEECDSLDVKVTVRAAARRHRVPLIMETSDRGLLDVERYDLEPDRPLFHGLLGDTPPEALRGLDTHDKVPYVLRILEPDLLSDRMAASMAEVDETVHTWPQLGSDIMLGAASVATAVRRLGRGEPLPSGRVRVDLSRVLDRITEPDTSTPLIDPATADRTTAAAGAVGSDGHDGDGLTPALTDPRLRALVEAAHRAPSGGNTQPWHFHLTPDALSIRLAPEMTSTMDVDYRGSLVAIGAALFNARVAAARHGLLGGYQIEPGTRAEDLKVQLTLRSDGRGDRTESDGHDRAALAARYDDVLARSSNRHIGRPGGWTDEVERRLRQRAREAGAGIAIVTDSTRLGELAEVLGESDRLRYLTPQLHREMMRELRWPGHDPLDWGLDVRSLELDDSDVAKLAVARRPDVMARLADWDVGRALGEATRDRVGAAAALVVVTAPDDSRIGWIEAGQAVESVWAQAQADGFGVQAVSPVFLFAVHDADFDTLSPRYAGQLRELAGRFRHLIGVAAQPLALVLRLAQCPPPSVPSRRVPLTRVLATAAGTPVSGG